MVENVHIAVWEKRNFKKHTRTHRQLHYNKQFCTVWYTTASTGLAEREGGGGCWIRMRGGGGCWQMCNTIVKKRPRKFEGAPKKCDGGGVSVFVGVFFFFFLRRVGGAEGGARGVGAAVVAEGAGTRHATAHAAAHPAATPSAVGPLQHARLELGVAARVFHQVVAAHEAFVAQRAAELLLPGVGAVVARQLVGAGELLTAVGPGAGERPFTCGNKQGASAAVSVCSDRHWKQMATKYWTNCEGTNLLKDSQVQNSFI